MQNHFKSTVAAIALACIALFPSLAVADTAADEAAIREIWSTYAEARVAGDAKTWLSLWDKEGIRMPPGAPAMDYETFAPGTAANFTSGPTAMEVNAEEIVVTDEWAYSRGTFMVNDADEGKFLTIFKRQNDGSWRIYRDSFSMNSQ